MRVNPKEIISLVNKGNLPKDVASQLSIHRSTVYRWLAKACRTDGRKLSRLSTRPHHTHKYHFTPLQSLEIERYRKRTGRMAKKIVFDLHLPVSDRTLHKFLESKGLVRKYGYHRRPKFQNTIHMHAKNTPTIGYLQYDVKYITPELSGLPWTCFEYAAIDIFSRYKEAVILNHLDQDGSMVAILEILPKLPFKPVFIQTDNGLEFQGRFHKMCEDMNLKHHMIHKNSPNENALIERSFRTDEEEFFFMLEKAPQHYDELRSWFADWLLEYNYHRPHLSLELKTPYQVVANVLSS
jgi:putative transposase